MKEIRSEGDGQNSSAWLAFSLVAEAAVTQAPVALILQGAVGTYHGKIDLTLIRNFSKEKRGLCFIIGKITVQCISARLNHYGLQF